MPREFAEQPPVPDKLSLWRRSWWLFCSTVCMVWFTLCYRLKRSGKHHLPRGGERGVLLVANHQSHFDPIIAGLCCYPRPFFALARETLFKHGVFRWLIESLNAIPVDQESADTAAMRTCIEALKKGHPLLIFPEGSRTPDGAVQEFEPGTILLIRRAKPLVVPVAIEGAFGVWPRHRGGPAAFGRLAVRYGEPIEPNVLTQRGVDGLAILREKIDAMRAELRTELGD